METNFYKNKITRLLCSLAMIFGFVGFAQAQVTNINFDAPPYVVGQEYEVTFDYDGSYDNGSSISVALVDIDGNFTILSTFTTAGAVAAEELSFTIPDVDMDFEEIRLIAYEGSTLNNTNRIDFTLDDFIVAQGFTAVFNSGPATDNGFDMYAAGNREMLTKAYDLTDKENLELRFNYWALGGTIDANGDLPVIPRLEYSTNGGASFSALDYTTPVNGSDLDDNFLYQSSFPYVVEIPASLLNETAVHFRWSQPLNGGLNQDHWQLYEARLQFDNNVIDDNLYVDNFGAGIVIAPPTGNFTYTQVDRTTDPVFNGKDFTITYELDDPVNDPDFPAGTQFVFTINSQDPETGDNVVVASGAFDADNYAANMPAYISAGTYSVLLTATNTVGGETYTYYDEQFIGTIRVFNKFVSTVYNGDQNTVLYAGSQVSFSTDVQNNATNVGDYDDVWFNLVVNYGGEDWVLAARQGGIDQPLTADLPPFLTGNNNYQIRASLNAPLAEVGQTIQNTNFRYTDQNANQNFLNFNDRLSYWNGCQGCGFFTNELQFIAKNGRRTVTTVDRDLTNSTLLNFEVAFFNYDEDNQDNNLILEYSTDGGATYTSLASYPDMRFSNNTNWIVEKITIPQAARTAATRFRFSQEEASGTTVRIRQMETTSIPEFPFTLSGVNVNVVRQEIFPMDDVATTICIDEEYTLDYELRGVVGADAQIELRYRLENEGLYRNFGSFDVNEEGNISFRIQDATSQPNPFPTGLVNVQFDVRINDQTFADLGQNYTTLRRATEQPIQLVPRVNQGTAVSQVTEECGRVVFIAGGNVQDGFSYRLRNRITDEWLSDAIVAEAGTDVRFELGAVAQRIDAEVVVSARNPEGDIICGNASVLNATPTINSTVLAVGEDQMTGALVLADSEYGICESGAMNTEPRLRIVQDTRTGLNTALGGGVNVTWYRNNMDNQVTTGLQITNFQRSGAYFAVISIDGQCSITTDPIQINVTPAVATPTITSEGDLQFCRGEGSVTLIAPEGYARYWWFRGGAEISAAGNGSTGNSNTITVQQTGSYTVYVETETGCVSAQSPAVVVSQLPTPTVSTTYSTTQTDNTMCGEGAFTFSTGSNNNQEYRLISAETGTALSGWVQGTGGTIQIMTNALSEPTRARVETRLLDGSGCGTVESNDFLLNFRDLVVEVRGNRITANVTNAAGTTTYTWFRNDQVMLNATGSSITVYDEAEYSVEVTFSNSACVLSSGPISNRVMSADLENTFRVDVYPNPTNDRVSVKVASNYQGNVTLRLTDLNGRTMSQEVVSKDMMEQTYPLSLSNLNQGVYNLQLIYEGNVENMRIVKK